MLPAHRGPGLLSARIRSLPSKSRGWRQREETYFTYPQRFGSQDSLLPSWCPVVATYHFRPPVATYGLLPLLLIAPPFPTLCSIHSKTQRTQQLLEAGADPHIRTGPLQAPPLAVILINKREHGAVNAVATHPKIGPLLVRALIAAGADVNQLATDPRGHTPLQMACAEGACAEVVQALLDAGADMLPPCPSVFFLSPLHVAAYQGGNAGAVRLLVNHPQSGGLNAVAGSDG